MENGVDQINQSLKKVSMAQEANRRKRWQLEELEQDCQRLSSKHQAFLADILQSPQNEAAYQYFYNMEEEVQSLYQKNFFELEDEKEQLQLEAKELSRSQEQLLLKKKRVLMEELGEKGETNGA